MKAITVRQPWTTAIARGSKQIETRSWYTRYRGPIAIHAAARALSVDELIDLHACYNWCAALGWCMATTSLEAARDSLPLGAIIAVAELIECRPTESFTLRELEGRHPAGANPESIFTWTERQLGDFAFDRYGWVLHNVRPLKWPRSYKGKQGLFNISDVLITEMEIEKEAV